MEKLLKQLANAAEGSIELDVLMLLQAGWKRGGPYWLAADGKIAKEFIHPTRSLDAIRALLEARGCKIVYLTIENEPLIYYVVVRTANGYRVAAGHANMILALCLAFCSILASSYGD